MKLMQLAQTQHGVALARRPGVQTNQKGPSLKLQFATRWHATDFGRFVRLCGAPSGASQAGFTGLQIESGFAPGKPFYTEENVDKPTSAC